MEGSFFSFLETFDHILKVEFIVAQSIQRASKDFQNRVTERKEVLVKDDICMLLKYEQMPPFNLANYGPSSRSMRHRNKPGRSPQVITDLGIRVTSS